MMEGVTEEKEGSRFDFKASGHLGTFRAGFLVHPCQNRTAVMGDDVAGVKPACPITLHCEHIVHRLKVDKAPPPSL